MEYFHYRFSSFHNIRLKWQRGICLLAHSRKLCN